MMAKGPQVFLLTTLPTLQVKVVPACQTNSDVTACGTSPHWTFCRKKMFPIEWYYYSVKLRDITMTSQWARRRLKSPASRLFIQDAGQRKHQSSASMASVRGIHRWPVNSPHKGQVSRKMFQFEDVIMNYSDICGSGNNVALGIYDVTYVNISHVWKDRSLWKRRH